MFNLCCELMCSTCLLVKSGNCVGNMRLLNVTEVVASFAKPFSQDFVSLVYFMLLLVRLVYNLYTVGNKIHILLAGEVRCCIHINVCLDTETHNARICVHKLNFNITDVFTCYFQDLDRELRMILSAPCK